MGYGLELKKVLKEKKVNVKELCRRTGIAPTTIYSCIQRDTSVRYDYALKIAECLEIAPSVICGTIPELSYHATGADSDLDMIIDLYKRSDDKTRKRLMQYAKKLSEDR